MEGQSWLGLVPGILLLLLAWWLNKKNNEQPQGKIDPATRKIAQIKAKQKTDSLSTSPKTNTDVPKKTLEEFWKEKYPNHMYPAYIFVHGLPVSRIISEHLYEKYEDLAPESPEIRVSLAQADLQKGLFQIRTLSHANLNGTSFSESLIWQCNFNFASMVSANLSQAQIKASTFQNADFFKAKIDNATMTGVELQGSSFLQADLTGVDIQNCQLDGVVFSYANLSGAKISNSSAKRAIFTNANFQDAVLRDVSFDGAIMPDGLVYDPAIHTHEMLTGKKLE